MRASEGRRSDHPEAFCEMCGRPNITWFVDSALWNKTVRDKANPLPEILCPVCFVKEYEQRFGEGPAWELKQEVRTL